MKRKASSPQDVPVDEGYELYDGESTDDEVGDGDESSEGDNDALLEGPVDENDEEAVPAEVSSEEYECEPELVADFNCLEKVHKFMADEKAQASANLAIFRKDGEHDFC